MPWFPFSKKTQEIPAPEDNNTDLHYDTYEDEMQLRRNMTQSDMLIGVTKLPIKQVEKDFNNSRDFQAQARLLSHHYSAFRRVARDGNCFYRAYMYSLFEYLLDKKSDELWRKFIQAIDETLEEMAKHHPQSLLEDFFEQFKECIDEVRSKQPSSDELALLFSDPNSSYAMCIPYIARLACAAYLHRNADDMAPFLPEEYTVEKFIQMEVEPAGKDADNIQIMSTAKWLGFAVKIVCLDPYIGRQVEGFSPRDNFCHEVTLPDSENYEVLLLFRPGHYEVLYER